MEQQEKIELLEKIEKYIQGKLSQEEIDELWIQFLQHPEYFEWFEAELHLRNLIKKGEKPDFFKPASQKIFLLTGFKGWVLATAAALLLVLGLQIFSLSENQALQNMALASIDTMELSGSDVYRSADEEVNTHNVAINEALAMAYANETDQAIHHFRQLLEEPLNDSQIVKIQINLGILLYNTRSYEEAISHFKAVTENDNADRFEKEKSWWFLGNTYLNLGKPAEARAAVFNAYTQAGRFQNPALALLKNLDLQLDYILSEE